MSLLPFTEDDVLYPTWRCDPEMADLADRHYSRQHTGAREFMPIGKTLVLRNQSGTVLFGWCWNTVVRYDKQLGYNCVIFRNESQRLSSKIILEAEDWAVQRWGPNRMFTYVDTAKVKSRNPGYCFLMAGWKRVGYSKQRKKLLLAKVDPGNCPYVQVFDKFLSGVVERQCIKPKGHEGNHVVIEPNEDKPLECWSR